MLQNTLPKFQEYLREKHLVPENTIQFFAYWASRFITFSNDNSKLAKNIRIEQFLLQLKSQPNIFDWQIQQAHQAITLYTGIFGAPETTRIPPNFFKNPAVSAILHTMMQEIRLKHYSYSTERSYIDWAKRFYTFCLKKGKNIDSLVSLDVKEFLSVLAVTERVSASTQNQAF